MATDALPTADQQRGPDDSDEVGTVSEQGAAGQRAGGSVIVGGARTPFGKLLGGLAAFEASDLGGIAIAAALERTGIDPAEVDQVILGQVLPAGAGQLPARQAAVKAGIGMDVPAVTINKVCLSGLTAVAMADQLIRSGEAEIVVAGGMESMTHAPHLLTGSRAGHKYGATTMVDHMEFDALSDVYTDQSMGALTEQYNKGSDEVTRSEGDAFAARSHRLAAAAAEVLADEIVEVTIPQRRGEPQYLAADEGVRPDADEQALAKLRPAFVPDGTITAGSSSPISDGAAVVIVASQAAVERLGLRPMARVGAYGQVAGPDSSLQLQPANAIRKACGRAGIEPAELDLIEINEAFAAVGIASARSLGLDADDIENKVNVHGGAIALGHPVGASGARLVLTLAAELQRRGQGTGAAALCGGGGQGDALLLSAL